MYETPRAAATAAGSRQRPAWGAGPLLAVLLVACTASPAPAPAAKPAAPSAPQAGAAPAAPAAQAAAPTAAPAPLKINVNWTAPVSVMAPFWIAHEAGIFREQGLDVELTNVASSGVAVQALVAGELHLTSLGPEAAILATNSGADLVMLYSQTNGLNFAVMSQPSIQQPQDLRGKIMGISRIGSAAHTAALVALRGWGLEPDRDVALRQLGDFGNVLPAFETGQLDAAVVGLPLRRETRARFNLLMNMLADGPVFPTTTINAQRSWVAANEEAVRRFGRAWVVSIQRLKTDKPLGQAMIRKYLQIDDPEILENEYEHAAGSLTAVPAVSEEGVARVLEFLVQREPSLAGRQAADWVDSRFVRELESSGFIRQVTGQ